MTTNLPLMITVVLIAQASTVYTAYRLVRLLVLIAAGRLAVRS